MKNVLLQTAIELNKRRKYRKGWQTIVRSLAICVVFCTTYVLILPAITIQEDPICGIVEHTHASECYSQPQAEFLGCGISEGIVVIHQHDALCRSEADELICPLPENVVHTHDETCYTLTDALVCPVTHVHSEECAKTETTLICTLAEEEAHTHSESCTFSQTVTVCADETHEHGDTCYETQLTECTLPETEGHTHSEACYSVTEIPCTEPTAQEHTHEDGCYRQQNELTCLLPELQLHSHSEACFDPEGILVCTLPAVVEHIHSEDCLMVPEDAEPILICELEEHVHDVPCYPLEEEAVIGPEYLCGSAVHTHADSCYGEDGALVCTIPEHNHEAACLAADLDLTADVETEEDWMRSVSAMTRTGAWPADVVAVAQTQLGYQESTKNLILTEDVLKGYTRYGACYGEPYADWNCLFVRFCLDYAGVEDFPVESNAARWAESLAAQQLYQEAESYEAKPGDLVFIDLDQTADAQEPIPVVADRVGIVAEVTYNAEQIPAQIKVIIGDQEDQVCSVTYDLSDPVVVGYGEMPEGDIIVRTFEGTDFTVTATYSRAAAIPKNAVLTVREIPADSEEYKLYYQQSLEALNNDSAAYSQEETTISFARFFDISFVDNGVVLEPAAPVDIEIIYSDVIAVPEEESGQVVHFAKDGVEVLQTNTGLTEDAQNAESGLLSEVVEVFTGETEQVDTFRFTQNSFSVTGTLLAARATPTATKVQPYEINNEGKVAYVLYAQVGNAYYALDGNGKPVQIAVSGNTLTLPTENVTNLFWRFTDKPNNNTAYLYNPVQNEGTGRHLHPFQNNNTDRGVTTGGAWDLQLEVSGDSFKIRGNGQNRVRMTATTAEPTTNNSQATTFYAAQVGNYNGTYSVWFDGTLGGMMSYYGAANECRQAFPEANGQAVIELPETWQSTAKYSYKLRGWYDIKNHTYYAVNPNDNMTVTATISDSTVFYADWIASSYDVGQNNEHVVSSLDTNDFITTHVFDYNALFNMLSQSHTGTVSAANHAETWTIYNNGETVPYNNEKSLGFAFVDYDAGGDLSYANNRDNTNANQSGITSGILTEVRNNSGEDLLDLLFNPNRDVLGKYYAGKGNYLFQYMDSTTANYDGEHDGYYYLDARLNAASYNQSQQRFYVYDYLERTSDSRKDGGAGQYSDLLPFNSPYQFREDQVDSYTDPVRRTGYEYDAKDGASSYQDYNSVDDATTNYFFGLRTDIEFFLPNDTNTQDEYGNYGNISTRGQHMVFEFHGDDDVWVFVDGQLMLDIGGLHGIMHGRIDFSTGTIAYGADGTENVSKFNLSEGTHTMTVYYMERGSSQSNCAIYFNIAPRYDLEITKEDIVTANKLDGAVFSVFNDEAMTEPAELWPSFEAHESGAPSTNTFTVVDGIAKCWGISAGKTYYIYETTPPPGYPQSDDMIRITLNNRGTATIEATTLHGSNGVATEGFAVIKQDVNDTLKIVALTVTNQLEGETTEVRVEKTWDSNSINLPQYITVYLTADGERIGRSARLTEGNGWSYTWTGLPKYRAEGIDEEIEYVVEEVFVPDYITVQGDSVKVENYVDWVRVDQMSDSNTFLLVHNGNALTYNGSSFGWQERTAAEAADSYSAHWKVTTDHDGFHLKNELGYTLTYSSGGFYGVDSDAVALNQVFYYLNSRLVVHDHDVYYQFGANGSVVQEDGLAFQLYQKETLTGLLTNIVNKPVDEERQTFVEVNKVWNDGAELHTKDSVVVRLYADGKDTGRSVTLNAANNWEGSFEDLPYYQDGTTTRIEYTVVEDPINNYVPNYSDGDTLSGRPVSFWQIVTQLEAGSDAYRVYANGYALAVASDNDATAIPNDLDDTAQQWNVVNRNGTLVLQNIGTGRYLQLNSTDLTTTGNLYQASAVTITDGYLTVGGRYLELGSGYAGVTDTAANVDKASFRISRWTTSSGMEGLGYTVTNLLAMYELPETGGSGTSLFTFAGLLMIAASFVYICITGRKRQKGGR